jgi:hypothetical protein
VSYSLLFFLYPVFIYRLNLVISIILPKGKNYFDAEKYSDAMKEFEAAKACPNSNLTEINEWIKKIKSISLSKPVR